jgi:hypothetical protein
MAFFSKKNSGDRTIESVPFFPVIAWSIFLMFSAFVYLLTNELKQTTVVLEAATFENVHALENGVDSLPLE